MRRLSDLALLIVILVALPAIGCKKRAIEYEVNTTLTTPKGVRIDPSNNVVDPAAVDCIIDKVEACLIRAFGNPPVIPQALMTTALCTSPTFTLPIARDKLRLKIPAEIPSTLVGQDWQPITREGLGWHLGCAGTGQLLTLPAGDAGCTAKGLTPTNTCPCLWRANMLDATTIVATPSLYLFPDWVIRYTTGCQNPWGNPEFAACARPLTGPLDKTAACSAA